MKVKVTRVYSTHSMKGGTSCLTSADVDAEDISGREDIDELISRLTELKKLFPGKTQPLIILCGFLSIHSC
ncbi:MAG: hypothetical protein LBG15_08220 [Dysgonamonadaceae bacterium]|jgi:hypothetical protein|nr:hypothetical protein [Dysgonamonadaceae bacterium]